MKKKLIILASVLCFLGVVLFVGGFSALNFSLERLDLGEPLQEVKKEMSLDQVNKISLSSNNFSVVVQISQDDLVHFTYYENKEYTFDIAHDSKEIILKEKYHFNLWKNLTYMFSDMALNEHTLLLEIPLSYVGQLDVSSVNGTIAVNGFPNLSFLKLDNTNGRIQVEDVNAVYYEVSTVNANSTFLNTNGKEFQYDTVNGSLRFDLALFDTYALSTLNGRISGTLLGVKDEYSISINNVNGFINLPKQRVIGSSKKIDISSVNGNVDLHFNS